VTVITIGADTTGGGGGGSGAGGNNGGILPSVLRGKPRVVAASGSGGGRPTISSRPDVSRIFSTNCEENIVVYRTYRYLYNGFEGLRYYILAIETL
jgi:hypothetical protein